MSEYSTSVWCSTSLKVINNIIENYLEELGSKRFQTIAKKSGVSIEDVKKAARIISLFEPEPARNYRPIRSNLYIKPDIMITMDENDQYHIRINNDGNPPLRVNIHYYIIL